MSDLARAWNAFKAAGDNLVAALEGLPAKPAVPAPDIKTSAALNVRRTVVTPTTPASEVLARATQRQGGKDLPQSLTPSKKEVVLTPEQRDEVRPTIIALAVDCIRAVGKDSPHLLQGVMGQVGLKHVIADATVISEAIAAAKASAP